MASREPLQESGELLSPTSVAEPGRDEPAPKRAATSPKAKADEEGKQAEKDKHADEGQGKVDKVLDELKEVKKLLESIQKTSDKHSETSRQIELRQSRLQGEGTDAVRAMHQWAMAEVSTLSAKAVECIASRVRSKVTPGSEVQRGTYSEIFYDKDLRRAQSSLILAFFALVEQEFEFFGTGDEHEQGWVGMRLPELRALLKSEGCKLPPLPVELENMLELALPLDRRLEPYLPSKLFNWMAPSSMVTSELTADEVNNKFEKLPKPIRKLIEAMPKDEKVTDPRIKLMHASTYYNEFLERFHESRRIVKKHGEELEQKRKEEDGTLKAEGELDKEWCEKVELAMGKVCPVMAETIKTAELLQAKVADAKAAEKKAEKASDEKTDEP